MHVFVQQSVRHHNISNISCHSREWYLFYFLEKKNNDTCWKTENFHLNDKSIYIPNLIREFSLLSKAQQSQ